MEEDRDVRLRRLRLRSWRRGIREMDLILGGYADGALAGLEPTILDQFESLLAENDHDLYQWISGTVSSPKEFQEIVGRIQAKFGSCPLPLGRSL